jgi:hypothetical protein
LLKDADISRLYVESITELRITDVADEFPELGRVSLDDAARNFLNSVARILDLEAEGSFTFWESEHLAELLEDAGFVGVETRLSFGNPEQATVVSGFLPR